MLLASALVSLAAHRGRFGFFACLQALIEVSGLRCYWTSSVCLPRARLFRNCVVYLHRKPIAPTGKLMHKMRSPHDLMHYFQFCFLRLVAARIRHLSGCSIREDAFDRTSRFQQKDQRSTTEGVNKHGNHRQPDHIGYHDHSPFHRPIVALPPTHIPRGPCNVGAQARSWHPRGSKASFVG